MNPKHLYRNWAALIIGAVLALGAPSFTVAAEPSMHEIYATLEAGDVSRARQMIDGVLKDHPRSAKAHFVAAEVAVKARDGRTARRELSTAEALAPGLPFATPESVAALRSAVNRASSTGALSASSRPDGASIPWGMIALGALALGAIVYAMSRRRPAAAPYDSGYPANAGGAPVPPSPLQPGPAPSTGSGLMGSLATGAALGAGIVAGEAVAHRVFGAEDHDPRARERADLPDSPPIEPDFGISDGSWDDGGADSSGGSDDWS